MQHTHEKRTNTRLEIIQLAAHLFIEEGYSNTSLSSIAKRLGISTGNLTFYFPTKDHLLAVLVDEQFAFQNMMMEQEAAEGKSSLLAYCLELTAMASVCEESEVARDFYAAAYASPLTLSLIRENDTEKTKAVFSPFDPNFTDADWVAIENIVSGIEYATIMTREENTPLPVQIEKTLDTILYLYGVPKEIREMKIKKVLAMDYRALGERILREFREYIEKVNEENLARAVRERKKAEALKRAR